ncbi:MAG: hypothetical protein IKD76_06825 [Clostridia bacterium]|nr:hypothetical protein [Clostridia bacterium]
MTQKRKINNIVEIYEMIYNNITNNILMTKGGNFTMSKSDIVNVKMVITEEKILANIEKVQKMINPNSKKQIVKLEEDSYFKDLIESIKTYLIEYPEKDKFPKSVYDAAYELVEYATSQFEENTKLIEDLIRQREKNIGLATTLKETLQIVESKDDEWKKKVQELSVEDYSEEVIDTLGQMGRAKNNKTPNYLEALKLINTKIGNLESNFHIEIDMERIEDRSKALSYIGIEIADALKEIPVPQDKLEKIENEDNAQNIEETENADIHYYEDTRVNVKPSLWERIKNMKIIRSIRYLMRIRIVLELPSALPEGKDDEQHQN